LFEMLGCFFESVGPVFFLGVNIVVIVSDAWRRINWVDTNRWIRSTVGRLRPIS
jgi:hypothetical protein